MNTSESSMVIRDNTGNPAPLGLACFGMTTVLLNIANAGFISMNSMILSMGIFVGGLAQVMAGFQEWKKNNTFGATAFTAYGFFWLALAGMILLPKTSMGAGFAPDPHAMGFFMLLWGLFTLYMFAATLKLNRMLQTVFLSLTVLFFLLAAAEFSGNASVKTLAGFEGIICGLSACYGSAALILNEVYGRAVLPLGAVKSGNNPGTATGLPSAMA